MILKQINFIFLVSIVCISAFDFDNLTIDIQSKQVNIVMPEDLQLGSAFFYTELPDECSLGYTFSKNASKLEYRQDLAKELKPNDSLRILGIFETNGTLLRKVYDYKINANGQPEKQNTSPIAKPCPTSEPRNTLNCEKSVTVINFDDYNCSNELIYTEKFDTFPKHAFTKEIRARIRTIEKEFVAFVDNDATCFVENGYLHLKAVWVYETYEKFLLDNCTSKLSPARRSMECGPNYQQPQFSLPPVFSANLRNKFHFKFGRVDIRAKMPRGNYLIPHLMLVPSGKDTEDSYVSHLRIAFSRGDNLLTDFTKMDIGGNVVYGGAYVNNGTKLTEHIVALSKERLRTFSENFHTYSIIWRKDIIIFLVDDISYGTITDKNILKEFDTECYLVLGLTAGGKHNYPDDSIFDATKTLDLFIEAKKQNRITWQEPSLLIDWINVYSVGEQDPQFAVNK